jgi:hypothetical protein
MFTIGTTNFSKFTAFLLEFIGNNAGGNLQHAMGIMAAINQIRLDRDVSESKETGLWATLRGEGNKKQTRVNLQLSSTSRSNLIWFIAACTWRVANFRQCYSLRTPTNFRNFRKFGEIGHSNCKHVGIQVWFFERFKGIF